jgi:hypothetical protein
VPDAGRPDEWEPVLPIDELPTGRVVAVDIDDEEAVCWALQRAFERAAARFPLSIWANASI